MNAVELIKERRSIRSFEDKKVDRELMKEVVDLARFAPSWANFQIARYTLIDDPKKIEQLASDAVHGFAYNIGTLEKAPGVAVLSFVKGKSGKLDPKKADYATSKASSWEVFDAGIACQTFCLAAFEKGLGTCIFGVIDDESIAKIANLPEEETVAALIVYGHPTGEGASTSRKPVEDILRFAD